MSEQSSRRLLFIDDNALARNRFKAALQQAGYSVETVATAESGLALFLEHPFPLVVVGSQRDKGSGLDVCRQLVKHDADPALILMTGSGDEHVISEAITLGVQRCVPLIDDSTYSDVLPVVVTHILDRRRASIKALAMEEELRRNEERFLQSEIISQSCHWESDQSLSNWAYASNNTENILGVTVQDLLGDYEKYIGYIHPDDQLRIRDIYAAAALGHTPYEAHYRFCRPDGRIIHLLENAVPILSDSGETLFYRGSTRDVTALDETRERFRTVVENAVEAIITIDSDGIIQSFNRAAETLFQYRRSDAVGQNINILMPADQSVRHDAYLSDYLSSRQAHIIGIGREVVAKRRDGSTFPAMLSVSEHDVGGEISFTGLLRDISDQKKSEKLLIQAKNEAERANRAKSEFLSSMSHELRTPLNAVLGFAQMLEYNPKEPLSPAQQENVDLIKRGGHHLLTLINQVLELAKIEAGKLDLSIETLDLSQLIAECASIAQATAMNRNIILTNLAAGKAVSYIRADNTRLKQVLLNLLSNAVKYNKDAGSIRIDVAETDDGFVRVSVADTGIGLSEREKKKVFEPFERLGKQSEDIEGTGIGLTITRQLVLMMGGRMGFVSELGEGSTFWFELPRPKAGMKDRPEQRSVHVHDGTSGPIAEPSTHYNILYVEDSDANALLMNRIFDTIPNADLHVEKTGRAGVQHAKLHKPDVILMDINLPDISGVEAAKILQRKPETRNIPIIAVSASIWRAKNGVPEDVVFYQYVEKPFEVVEIRSVILDALSDVQKKP